MLTAWLHRYLAFFTSKHQIASKLLEHTDSSDPVFGQSRARVLAGLAGHMNRLVYSAEFESSRRRANGDRIGTRATSLTPISPARS
jgi:hypothetical protein